VRTIYDELIKIIKTNYSRFKDSNRCLQGKNVTLAMLGYEDCILIKPLPSDSVTLLTDGKIVQYNFELQYFKKLHYEQDESLNDLSEFAEALDLVLLGYKNHTGYWHELKTSIDYDIVFEEEDFNIDGFVMTLNFLRYKNE